MAMNYYTKIIPTLYTDFLGIMGPFKRLLATIQGFSKPMYRQVLSRDTDIVAPKKYRFSSTEFYA